MYELIQKSGIVIYPIIALSVLAFAIFMERLYTLRINSFAPANFVNKLLELLKAKEYSDAANLCAIQNNAMSRIATEIIANRKRSASHLTTITEDAGRSEADKISRFQETLSTIVSLAPLLGLLGTVFGMIKIFNVLSTGGVGNAQALSGGIAEALLTTAAGLSVAIPAQVFYYIVKFRADGIVKTLETNAAKVVNIISSDGE